MLNELNLFNILKKLYPVIVLAGLVTSYATAKNIGSELNPKKSPTFQMHPSNDLLEQKCTLKTFTQKTC